MGTITVSNLGKAYKQYPTRWSRLAEWLLPSHKPRHQLRWVLKDISFTVEPGETIGILGVNGAGKSTLLKMITGTTQPTSGSVNVTGRVAALLELGMGFHPDFTGRQNAFMAGQLLGLSQGEIQEKIVEIESFANIGDYFDQPVRIYSSGMQARVAFSVATCTQPDVLIIDEALSVGDIAFQSKCIQRMEVLQKRGVTVLLVSHALNQVRQFCQKALYLSDGGIKAFGDATKVCDIYHNDLIEIGPINKSLSSTYTNTNINTAMDLESKGFIEDPSLRDYSVIDQPISKAMQITAFEILDEAGNVINKCRRNQKITFKAYIKANESVPAGAAVGPLVADKTGYGLMACNSNYYDVFLPEMKAGERIIVQWKLVFPFANGEYRIDIGLKPEVLGNKFYDLIHSAKTLTVMLDEDLVKKHYGAFIYTEAEVKVVKVDNLANNKQDQLSKALDL